jgi:cytochrome c553
VRQLYDFKHGARAGPGGAPMQLVVQQLTVDDMLALAAYTASLPP